MKYGLLAAALFLFSYRFFTQSTLEVNNPDFTLKDETLYFKSAPFNGKTVERYPAGQIYRETHYKHGLKEGFAFEYAIDGQLRSQWSYHLGKKHGVQKGWFIEGPKRFVANFKDGVLDGPQTEWHMNGAVFRQETFIEGREVDKKILYRSGEVFTNYTIRNSRLYGVDGGPLCFEPKKEGAVPSNKL